MQSSRKNYKVVYTIVQRARDGKRFWLRIGAAFLNRDGSLNVQLDAMPTNGTLQIRDYRPFGEAGSAGKEPRRELRGGELSLVEEAVAAG